MVTTKLRIRPAFAHEAQALAKVAAAAFLDDPFDTYMYPNRKQHYQSYQRIYQQKFGSHINQPLCWIMVVEAITQVSDKDGTITDEGATPAAYAVWARESSKKRKETQRRLQSLGLRDPAACVSFAQRCKKRIMNCGLIEAIRDKSNPVVDRERFSACWGSLSAIDDDSDYDPDSEPDEYWHLQELSVAPEFRRRGAARMLLEWGQDWARKENVPVLLESASVGETII